MKIGGNYILSRRNIARMIVALGTALMLLCSDTTAQAKDFVNRIHDTTDSLVSIDRQMVEATCTVVPEAKYRECKSVYLEAKRYNKEHGNPEKTARRDVSPHHAARRWGEPSGRAVAARPESAPYHAANPEPRPPTVGFMVELRKKINEIHDASVLGKPPPDKRLRGLIRQKQVLYGVDQYKPHEVSFEKAARMAITAFKGERGAYSEREWKSLKQAIRRHVLDDRKKFAT